jgi:hypothetical protein
MAEGTRNLADFKEDDVNAVIDSPRSIRACAKEGVKPLDLVFKPVDQFAEKGLSPRLVKLRFDFFEAKRKDLLTACRRARSQLISKQERGQHPPIGPDATVNTSMVAAASALESDTIRLEKHKLARVQANERRWLQSALGAELDNLKKLEMGAQQAAQEAADDSAAMKAESDRRKAEGDRKRAEEHQKALEQAAQQRLERELARQEFEKEQEAQHQRAIQAAKDKKAKRALEIEEENRKHQRELEKQAAQERAWQRQQERINEMAEKDAERREVLEQQKADQGRLMEERAMAKANRMEKSMQNNLDIERQREQDFNDRMENDRIRNEKLALERRLFQEQAAKKSLQMLLKRRSIAEESNRQNEEKRQNTLEAMEEVDNRMLEHEMKKQRYLEFKRELDHLKEKNKELNVERTRRRQEFKRETTSEACRQKTMKADMTILERQRLWDERRKTALLSQQARDDIRGEITRQKIKSQFDSKIAKNMLNEIFQTEQFNPKDATQSMPNLPKI